MAEHRIVVVAAKPFEYRGCPVEPTDVCVMEPAEAAAMVYQRAAYFPATDEAYGVYRRRDLVADVAPRRRRRRTVA